MSMRVKHEQCPRCRANGRDTRGDNMGVYPDGGKHCFACGYTVPAREVTALSNAIANLYKTMDTVPQDSPTLPNDVSFDFSEQALMWLRKYDIYEEEILAHNVCYSLDYDAVVFPYYAPTPFQIPEEDEDLVGYQMRFMKDDRWVSYGDIGSLVYIINKSENINSVIVVVEDILSAIKVGRNIPTVPLFGSSRSAIERMMQTLSRNYKHIIYWLDKDAQSRAIWAAQTTPLYNARGSMICTEYDPKAYTTSDIISHVAKVTAIELSTKDAVAANG